MNCSALKKYLPKNLSNLISLAVVVCSMVFLVLCSSDVSNSARNGLTVCFNIIIPSLFPFFVLSQLASELGIGSYTSKLFMPLMEKLFRLNADCTPAFILGLLGGYPLGAKVAIGLYESGVCSREDTERMLGFCNNSGPAFIFGAVGAGLFKSSAAGVIIYISTILSATTVGTISGLFTKSRKSSLPSPPSSSHAANPQRRSFSAAFSGSLKSSLAAVLNICSVVVFFAVVDEVLNILGIIPCIASKFSELFGWEQGLFACIVKGFIELTSGIIALSSLAVPVSSKLIAASLMSGFGGLSIHCQTMSLYSKDDLSFKPYFAGKLLTSLFSALYTFLITIAFPLKTSAASLGTNTVGLSFLQIMGGQFSYSAVVCIFMCGAVFIPSFVKYIVLKART